MKYTADSLHYAPQSMYVTRKWQDVGDDGARDYDPEEIIWDVARRAGIEVVE